MLTLFCLLPDFSHSILFRLYIFILLFVIILVSMLYKCGKLQLFTSLYSTMVAVGL